MPLADARLLAKSLPVGVDVLDNRGGNWTLVETVRSTRLGTFGVADGM